MGLMFVFEVIVMMRMMVIEKAFDTTKRNERVTCTQTGMKAVKLYKYETIAIHDKAEVRVRAQPCVGVRT